MVSVGGEIQVTWQPTNCGNSAYIERYKIAYWRVDGHRRDAKGPSSISALLFYPATCMYMAHPILPDLL